MKFLLILVTFSQEPSGVFLEQAGSFGNMKSCLEFARENNEKSKSRNEVLACMKVE